MERRKIYQTPMEKRMVFRAIDNDVNVRIILAMVATILLIFPTLKLSIMLQNKQYFSLFLTFLFSIFTAFLLVRGLIATIHDTVLKIDDGIIIKPQNILEKPGRALYKTVCLEGGSLNNKIKCRNILGYHFKTRQKVRIVWLRYRSTPFVIPNSKM